MAILPVKTLFGRPGLVDGGIPASIPGDYYWPAVKAALIDSMNSAPASVATSGDGAGGAIVAGPHGESATQYGFDSGEWALAPVAGAAPYRPLTLDTGWRSGAREWQERRAAVADRTEARRRRCSRGVGGWADVFQQGVASGITTVEQYALRPEPGTLIQSGNSTIYRQPTGNQSNLPVAGGSVNVSTSPGLGMAAAIGAAVLLVGVVVVMNKR